MSLSVPVQNHNTSIGNVRVTNDGGVQWLHLPTGNDNNRRFLISLAVNDEEVRVIALPSHDIQIRMSADKTVLQMVASIVRREDYFRAMLIQSRGHAVRACLNKCATIANPRFRQCVRLDSYRDGACAECVFQSHGARCQHKGAGDVSSDDNNNDSSDDDDGPAPSNYKRPSVRKGRNQRTPGKRLGKNVGTSGSFLGSSHNPQLIEKE